MKKRRRNIFTKKNNDNLEAFEENEFNNIKSNNYMQNGQNILQENKKPIINEKESSTNFSTSTNNNNEKKNKIQIEKYELAFDLNEEKGIQQKNICFNCLSLWNNIMNIQDLSNEINRVMKELNIDKKI